MGDEPTRGRILIIDDNVGTCRTLTLVFKRLGYHAQSAHSGEEAMELAEQSLFDAAFLDIRLPDMAGIELLAPLKQKHPDIVVIMLTAHASVETAVRALNDGAYAYITKPFNMEEVLTTVHRGFEQQHLVRENRRLQHKAREAEKDREQLRNQLYQADRMASLGMLAASVAHEINNPLTYLLYNLGTLTEELPQLSLAADQLHSMVDRLLPDASQDLQESDAAILTDPRRLDDLVERARHALEGARRVQNIARDLRTFARVQEDRNVPLSVNQIIESAINIAVNEFKYRARLIKEYGKLPTIVANDGRLSQVFLNLLVNAAQSFDSPVPEHNEIRVRTWSEDDEVLVEIRDTGRGIPPEDLERIFEPFYSTKSRDKGSGLGLPICNGIITDYGGRIDVQSEVGQGSRFTVHLPVQELSEDEAVTIEIPRNASSSGMGPYGRILVIDDEPNFCAAVQRALQDDFLVLAVNSGLEGKKLLEQDTAFDIVVCDLLMPQMTGMELHAYLLQVNPDLAGRMIFITGGAFTPVAQEFLQRISNLHLEKPFELRSLRALLREIIAKRAAEGGQSRA